jgi:hypothetical protein
LFSFIAFFLFIAVLPLVYAPETLPEKTMKDRDLKSYIDKAMKKAQVQEEKQQKTVQKRSQECDAKFPAEAEDDTEKYEKAKQLAEKYY